MEIERKFLVAAPPSGYEAFPFHQIEQAYLCTGPVVRIRREDRKRTEISWKKSAICCPFRDGLTLRSRWMSLKAFFPD